MGPRPRHSPDRPGCPTDGLAGCVVFWRVLERISGERPGRGGLCRILAGSGEKFGRSTGAWPVVSYFGGFQEILPLLDAFGSLSKRNGNRSRQHLQRFTFIFKPLFETRQGAQCECKTRTSATRSAPFLSQVRRHRVPSGIAARTTNAASSDLRKNSRLTIATVAPSQNGFSHNFELAIREGEAGQTDVDQFRARPARRDNQTKVRIAVTRPVICKRLQTACPGTGSDLSASLDMSSHDPLRQVNWSFGGSAFVFLELFVSNWFEFVGRNVCHRRRNPL
jgi:hypothetical protein